MGLLCVVFLTLFLLIPLSISVNFNPEYETLYNVIQRHQKVSNVLNAKNAPFPSKILNSTQLFQLLENKNNFKNGVTLELITKLYATIEAKLKYDQFGVKLPNVDLNSINLTVFHRYEDVNQIGRKMPLYFANQGPPSAVFLENPQPNFSNHNQVQCGSAVSGEERACVNSFKSMIEFVFHSMGTKVKPRPIYALPGKWQLYTVVGTSSTISNDVAGCHKMNVLPFAVYECHHIRNSTVRVVPLVGEDGTRVEAVSVCHMNTSSWNPYHLSFRIMNARPGVPVCHFLATDDIVWVTK